MIGKKKSASAGCPKRGPDWGVFFIIVITVAFATTVVVTGFDTSTFQR